MKDAFDVLLQLAMNTDKATVSQAQLNQTISDVAAGKFQYSKVAAILGQYSDIIRNVTTSLLSAGQTSQKVGTQMDTLAIKLQQLRATFLSFASGGASGGIENTLKSLVDWFNRLMLGLTNVSPAIFNTTAVVLGLTLGLKALMGFVQGTYSTIASLSKGFADLFAKIASATTVTTVNTATEEGNTAAIAGNTVATAENDAAIVANTAEKTVATAVTEGLTAATSALSITTAVATAGISLLVGGLLLWAEHAGQAQQSEEQLQATVQQAILTDTQRQQNIKEEISFVNELVSNYQQLSKEIKEDANDTQKVNDAKSKQQAIEQQLTRILGDGASQLFKNNQLTSDYISILDKLIDKLKKTGDAAKDSAQKEIDAQYKAAESTYNSVKSQIDSLTALQQSYTAVSGDLGQKYDFITAFKDLFTGKTSNTNIFGQKSYLDQLKEQADQANQTMWDLRHLSDELNAPTPPSGSGDSGGGGGSDLGTGTGGKINPVTDTMDQFKAQTDQYQAQLDEITAKLALLDNTSQAYRDELQKEIPIYQQQQDQYHQANEALRNLEATHKLTKSQLDELNTTLAQNSTHWEELQKKINDVNVEIQKSQWDEINNHIKDFDTKIQNAKSNVDNLDKVLKDYTDTTLPGYNKVMQQSIEANQNYIKTIQDKISYLEQEARQVGLTSEAYQNLKNQLVQTMTEELEAQETLKVTLLQNQINQYDNEKKASDDYYDNLIKQREEATKNYDQQMKEQEDLQVTALQNQIKQYDDEKKASDDYYDDLIKKQEEAIKQFDQQTQAQSELDNLNEKEQEIQNAMADTSYTYITAEGEKEYTYNREKVAELQQEYQKELDTYNNDQLRDALQQELDNLQNNKEQEDQVYDAKIQSLQDEVSQVKAQYDTAIKNYDAYAQQELDNLQNNKEQEDQVYNAKIQSLQNEESQVKAQYDLGIANLQNFANQESVTLNQLIQYWNSAATSIVADAQEIASAQASMSGGGGGGGTSAGGGGGTVLGAGGGTPNTWEQSNPGFYEYNPSSPSSLNPTTYDEGGIVGYSNNSPSDAANLLNTFFNMDNSHRIVKALVGELMIPPKNIANFLPNLKTALTSFVNAGASAIANTTNYTFNNVTVQANDLESFIESIRFYTQTV